MKRLVYIILIFLPFVSFSQKWELGLFLGGSNYNGDLVYQPPVELKETHPAIGIFTRYAFNEKFHLRASLLYGKLSGADSNYTEKNPWRGKRNLSFQNNIYEFAIQGEYNILPYINNHPNYFFAPYIFGGLALFYHNPQAKLGNKWYDLQPLGTEGQGIIPGLKKYNLLQVAIPFGFGIKYSVKTWNLGLEFGYRKTFTDYLDDVSSEYIDRGILAEENGKLAAILADRSFEARNYRFKENYRGFSPGSPRGNPDIDDWYMFAGFTISKTFYKNRCLTY